MSLPAPDLDDRKFQDIVDDVKRQIGLRCPEWTDHNVSDPGVTLLELFAYMTENILFRLNQVPEKNYIRFLELLGISLETPEPALTDLRFRLSRYIRDEAGEEENEMFLPARTTQAATVRTEYDDAIEFETDRDLRLVRPKVDFIVAVPNGGDLESFAGTRAFPLGKTLPRDAGFEVFSKVPTPGDALYVGFSTNVAMNLVGIEFDCLTAAASGLNEDYPSQIWEYWNGLTSTWDRLEIEEDETKGFNRIGRVDIVMPQQMQDRVLGGRRAYWIRARYTFDQSELPPRGIDQVVPSEYFKSPEIISVAAATIGGTSPASNCSTVFNEVLGRSDGLPGQTFKLHFSPVLRFRDDETVLIGAIGEDPADMSDWQVWTCVEDFSRSGPEDRHFTVDYLTGEISFGPNIPQPDGSTKTYGAVPEEGLTIAVSRYRYGGGVLGNVREGKIRVLKRAIAYVNGVYNPRAATGGRDRETIDRAKLRAKEILQIRNRAVTAEDFEFLSQKASSGVGRARCIQPVHYPPPNDAIVKPGVVKVLLIPSLSPELLSPKLKDLKVPERVVQDVHSYLDMRRLLTAQLEIGEPEYKFVSVHIRLVTDPRANSDTVQNRVVDQLNRYLHPIFGGPNGDGWPFRRSLTLADIYAQVGTVKGVAFLLDAKILVSTVLDAHEGVLGPEVAVSNAEGIRLEENELFCSRQHVITVVPMSMVGAEFNEDGG